MERRRPRITRRGLLTGAGRPRRARWFLEYESFEGRFDHRSSAGASGISRYAASIAELEALERTAGEKASARLGRTRRAFDAPSSPSATSGSSPTRGSSTRRSGRSAHAPAPAVRPKRARAGRRHPRHPRPRRPRRRTRDGPDGQARGGHGLHERPRGARSQPRLSRGPRPRAMGRGADRLAHHRGGAGAARHLRDRLRGPRERTRPCILQAIRGSIRICRDRGALRPRGLHPPGRRHASRGRALCT